MLHSKALASGIVKVASNTRHFHLGHEFAPPARFISHHARFGLALLSTAIQLSSFIALYLYADKLRPPPPRTLGAEVQAELEQIAASYESGTMKLKEY